MAISVFALVTSLLITIYPTAIRIISSGSKLTVASNLAQARIESLRIVSYDDLTIGTYENNQPADPNPNSPYNEYHNTVIVTYVDDNLATSGIETGLKKVTVTTSWYDPLRGQQSMSVSTLVTQY